MPSQRDIQTHKSTAYLGVTVIAEHKAHHSMHVFHLRDIQYTILSPLFLSLIKHQLVMDMETHKKVKVTHIHILIFHFTDLILNVLVKFDESYH